MHHFDYLLSPSISSTLVTSMHMFIGLVGFPFVSNEIVIPFFAPTI